jgi:hypothetical protein
LVKIGPDLAKIEIVIFLAIEIMIVGIGGTTGHEMMAMALILSTEKKIILEMISES